MCRSIIQLRAETAATDEDIEAAALVSQEGFIIASVLSDNLEEERVAALTAAFQGLAAAGKGDPTVRPLRGQPPGHREPWKQVSGRAPAGKNNVRRLFHALCLGATDSLYWGLYQDV